MKVNLLQERGLPAWARNPTRCRDLYLKSGASVESKARFLGHSVHQMLVVFPMGLLLASVAFDTLSYVVVEPTMSAVAYWTLAGGILGGLAAAPFGLVDLMKIPYGTRASRIGSRHAWGNVIALLLFIGSWLTRPGSETPVPTTAVVLSLAGAAVIVMTAWLGGELVTRLGVGVSPGAHLDAPSSMREPAKEATVANGNRLRTAEPVKAVPERTGAAPLAPRQQPESRF